MDGGSARIPSGPVCLDLTRTISRAGMGPATGIDRTERAYLEELLASGCDLTGLIRHATGVSLIDRAKLEQLSGLIAGNGTWGRRDAAGLLSRRICRARQVGESWIRRNAVVTVLRGREIGRLRRALPPNVIYLNVGHSNLEDATLAEIARVSGSRICVMVHDVIPLRHPEFQRAGTPARFREKLSVVARHADAVVCPSRTEASHVADWLGRFGATVQPVAVAPGLRIAAPEPGAAPMTPWQGRPYFVALGTIEPRKNIDLLLDVWERLAEGPGPVPGLAIVGRRGWAGAATLARLDAHRGPDSPIHEFGGLSDGGAAALVSGARALLFPSLAEGYGFPPHEAVALGVPAICSDLDVLRETLGERVVYADPRNVVEWERIVRGSRQRMSGPGGTGQAAQAGGGPRTWRSHVQTVLTVSA